MQKSMFDVLICRAKTETWFSKSFIFDLFDLQIQMQKLMLLFSGPSDLHTQNQKCNFCFFHLGRALTFVNLAGSEIQSMASSGKNRRAKQNPWEFPRMMKFCLSAQIPALSEKFCGQRTFCSGLWKAMRAFITQHDYLILNHHGRSCNNFVIWLKLNVHNAIAGLSFPRVGQFVRMGFLPHRLTFNS